jgi:hypothetical protein
VTLIVWGVAGAQIPHAGLFAQVGSLPGHPQDEFFPASRPVKRP